MRRFFGLLSIVLALSLLCSCAGAGETVSGAPSAAALSVSPKATALASPSPAANSPADLNAGRKELFRAFLSDNYKKLSDAFSGGISGIGFIDLDLDGAMEMIIFDAGASAAMGAQFFDVSDGKVECVSANMDAVAKAFGGSHLSKVVVNANYFDDFRLMKDKATGREFFLVQSANGAADFSYAELVKFGSENDVLTLDSLLYRYDNLDTETGEAASSNFKVAGKSATDRQYETAYRDFFAGSEDLGFEASGAFAWKGEFGSGKAGLLAMADEAMSEYSNSYAS